MFKYSFESFGRLLLLFSSSFSAREHNERRHEQIAEGLFGLAVAQGGLAASREASSLFFLSKDPVVTVCQHTVSCMSSHQHVATVLKCDSLKLKEIFFFLCSFIYPVGGGLGPPQGKSF